MIKNNGENLYEWASEMTSSVIASVTDTRSDHISTSGDQGSMMASTSSTDDHPPAWWAMRCERNHAWWRLVAAGGQLAPGDLTCPTDGTEAVTASKRELADRVTFRLIPAAWESEGAIGFEGEYFIEILGRTERQHLRSARTLAFEEACKRLSYFKGLSWVDSERYWDRLGLGKKDVMKMPGVGNEASPDPEP